jgi:hypothetical protein
MNTSGAFRLAALIAAVVASLFAFDPARAAVRAEVGDRLNAAIDATSRGDYASAAKLTSEAEEVGHLTDEERSDIEQMKRYLGVKSGGAFGTFDAKIAAQSKFATDYNAEHYSDAIEDEELLLSTGALTVDDVLVVEQAYYKLEDYKGCARYAAAHDISIENSTELQLRCDWAAHDESFVRSNIIRHLTIAEVAALAGCQDEATAHWQAATAIGYLNPDEQSITNRIKRLISSKAMLHSDGEKCSNLPIDDNPPWRITG